MVSRYTYIKHTVIKIWFRVHHLVAEAKRPIGSLNHFTLGPSRLLVGTLGARRAASITASVIACDLPGCPKFLWCGDHDSRWREVLIT